MKTYFSLSDFSYSGKTVIVRVGWDMPINDKGRVTNDDRIRETLPTLRYLIRKKAKIILLFHHHRPKGKIVAKFRAIHVTKRASLILGKSIKQLYDITGRDVEVAIEKLRPGGIIALENVRFSPLEEKGSAQLGKVLASYADYYVLEAFTNSHRDHASMTKICQYIPGCMGINTEENVKHLSLVGAKKPIYAILGGVKLETRIPLIEALAKKAKKILLGGAMVFTFLKAQGYGIGNSINDENYVKKAGELLKKYGNKLVLPEDIVVADRRDKNARSMVVSAKEMPAGWIGMDNGPASVETFGKIMSDAKTIVWNGAIGVFEIKKFAEGTKGIVKIMAKSSASTIVGGGDTSTSVKLFHASRRMTHVSSAGGASLTLLEGKKLPAVEALKKSYRKFK